MPPKFVDDLVRPAIVDTLILGKVMQGTTTVDQVERDVKNINIEMKDLNVRQRIEALQQTGHLRLENNNLRLTDDGKEDVNKVLPWFNQVTQQVRSTPGMAPGGGRR
jgi:coproporphyrinogen III oxidase-like Fe-S oxidoreductase